ncbi:MAG: hypothetical protein AAF725_07615, partial [Acidobacteriota bacterium]
RYGAALKSFDFDPAAAPQAAELEKFRAWAQGAPAVLLWDEEPSEAARAAFAEGGGGEVIHAVLDPLTGPRASGGYDPVAALRSNSSILAGLPPQTDAQP